MFIGYVKGVKGYKLWCDGHKKCIISRDVVFNESEMAYKTASNTNKGQLDPAPEKTMFEVEPIDTAQSKQDDNIPPEEECLEGTQPDVEDETNDYLLARDRTRRQIKPPEKFGYVDLMAFSLVAASEVWDDEPKSYKAAMASKEKLKWGKTMDEEMKSLHDNHTWELVKKPAGAKLVSRKWVYKMKEGISGVEQGRFKARLVARDFKQREDIDYNDVFLPVVKHMSIRILLAMVAKFDLELEQKDVKTTFFYGELEEVIYMRQPEGYEAKGKKDHACKLNKSFFKDTLSYGCKV